MTGSPEPAEGSDAGFSSLSELEAAAERLVRPEIWAYIQGGSGEEWALRCNRDAFHRRTVRARHLTGTAHLSLDCRMLGRPVRAPFFVAPTAYQGSIHPEGELATARATSRAGLLGVYSTLSTYSLEAIAEATGSAPRWFQLYVQPQLPESESLVQRAARAGYSAIVLTVDAPLLAVRDRQASLGFAIDADPPLGNGPGVVAPARRPEPQGDGYRLRTDAATTWEIVEQVRSSSGLPVVVKGILSGDQARLAVEHGAQGIIVSNHGGRQLEGAPATLDVLPEVVAAVGHRAEVYLDSGVRRASDVLMALALGARAVGVGRPILWALACGGEQGVSRYLALLREELAITMVLAGLRSPEDADGSLLGPTRW